MQGEAHLSISGKKDNGKYQSTTTASHSKKWPYCPIRSKEFTADGEL